MRADTSIYAPRRARMTLQTVVFFVLCVLFAGAVLTAGATAVRAKFNANPDEYVTGAAIEYYSAHWIPPDIRSPAVSATYSGYGRTRLAELDVYYFAAGKIDAVAKILLPHSGSLPLRLFNLLMLAAMAGIALKVYRKNPVPAFLLCLTPQLWYLFAYATSDAFDFFAGFLLLWQWTTPGSAFNRFLEGEARSVGRKAAGIAAAGLPLALLLTAKKNFYIILLVAAVFALKKIADCPSEKRRALFRRFIGVAGCALVLFALRYSVEIAHYGFKESAVVRQEIMIHAQPSYRPDAPAASRFAGLGMKSRGVSLSQMLFRNGFLRMSFESFMGLYGNMQFAMPKAYYLIMAAGYLVLFVAAVFECLRRRSGLWALLTAAASGVLLLALSAYNSWTSDFQPQGRYLLPWLITAGFAAGLSVMARPVGRFNAGGGENILGDNRAVPVALCLIGVLSLFSFVYGGLFLIPAG